MTFYAIAAVIPFRNVETGNYRIDFFTINNAFDPADAKQYMQHLPLSIQQWKNIGSVHEITLLTEEEYRKMRKIVGNREIFVGDLETFKAHVQDLREKISEQSRETRAEVTKA